MPDISVLVTPASSECSELLEPLRLYIKVCQNVKVNLDL